MRILPCRARAAFICALLSSALLWGCEDPKNHRTSESGKDTSRKFLKGGDLKFSDDFDRETIGSAYTSTSSLWKIQDGWVHVQGARNEGLWLTEKLPQRARIEFDARSESEDGDLKIEVFATQPKHEGGYVVIFGGWKNQLNVIARLDEHGSDRKVIPAPKVERGKTYRFAVIKANKTLSWYLDGKLVLSYPDPSPLSGRFLGFNNWETPVFYDNLKVYALD